MRILVTGATGFIGRHLVQSLLENGHSVLAVVRDAQRASTFSWFKEVDHVVLDLTTSKYDSAKRAKLADADAVAYLAWSGLPDYRNHAHFETTLPTSYHFLKSLVLHGHQRVLVTGTCLEYGLQEGCLSENHSTRPITPYGLAKDCLREFIESFRQTHPFQFQWARLFYMYGEGQQSNSLLAQFDAAVARGDRVFPMSGGEQLRDYLPVKEVARRLVRLVENPSLGGIVNVCHGEPISVRRLVEERIDKLDAKIELNLGHYSYPPYEPMAFWGDSRKFRTIEAP